MVVTNANMLTLATPAAADRCVFARDEPARSTRTEFVTVHTTDCRCGRGAGPGLDGLVERVPACEQDVRPFWPTCRSCGALLMAPPAPVVPLGTTPEPAPPGAPVANEQFFAPTVLHPITQLPPEAPPRCRCRRVAR